MKAPTESQEDRIKNGPNKLKNAEKLTNMKFNIWES